MERSGTPPLCFLDLYLDDKLDLAFPDGSEGMQSYDDDEDPLFFVQRGKDMGETGDRWIKGFGSFQATACRKAPGNCLRQVDSPAAFSRHLLQGLSLQTYNLLCDSFDPKHGPTEMWLLRAGRDPKELYAQSTEETATYRFAMPAALFEYATSRTRGAMRVYDKPLLPERERGRFSVPPSARERSD